MKTYRFVMEDDNTVDVRGDTVIYHEDHNGMLDFITVLDHLDNTVAIFPSAVIMYAIDLEYEDDPSAMEPEPMNKECGCECQHD